MQRIDGAGFRLQAMCLVGPVLIRAYRLWRNFEQAEKRKWQPMLLLKWEVIPWWLGIVLLLYRAVVLFLRIPTCALLYLILPVREFRFGVLNGKSLLANEISYIEPYVRKLEMDPASKRIIPLIVYHCKPSNGYMFRMYKRRIRLIGYDQPFIRAILQVIYDSVRNTRFDVSLREIMARPNWYKFREVWDYGPPLSTFTRDEEEMGKELLQRIGVANGRGVVCLINRGKRYYQEGHPVEFDHSGSFVRSSELRDYLAAAQYLALKNIYTLRMGTRVDHPLPETDPRIIDYASCFRSEFGDIYLVSKCKFMISGGAGLHWLASAFNVPVVYPNLLPLWFKPSRSTDLLIPKKLWSIREKRFLTFREMLSTRSGFKEMRECREWGVEVIDNIPEEIVAVVKEMNNRLDGTYVNNPEDEELQERFQALYRPGHMGYGYRARIGAEFLRENRALLD